MRYPLLVLALAALPLGAASAEDMQNGLPPACIAATRQAAPAMEGMEGMTHGADGMTAMHEGMAEAATIADPDLAFNCGMIAHHQGAIAMAEAELKSGKDAASRKLAEAIIAAQKQEIAAMTAWVEHYGH